VRLFRVERLELALAVLVKPLEFAAFVLTLQRVWNSGEVSKCDAV
jgi:hypothetical protein